ncbi:MAG: methyltransferase domain-containing protein [Bacteroidales bacterium]|nr:methyltransferase domain-containing protein [Bacteroidales bacterium]
MSTTYDKLYETEDLFGNPYPELIEFFTSHPNNGKVLDLGCGQGRNAIPLARLGFEVTGVDLTKVGISQMNQIAKSENLTLVGVLSDMYKIEEFKQYDFVLLDSMFHFTKKDRATETNFIIRLLFNIKIGCQVIFCIQDSGKKVSTLIDTVNTIKSVRKSIDKKLVYTFHDKSSGHKSKSDYRMIVISK